MAGLAAKVVKGAPLDVEARISPRHKARSAISRAASGLPRLANRNTRLTTGAMERFLKKVGVSGRSYRLWTAMSLKEEIAANPSWGLRDWQTLVMENLELIAECR